MTEHQDEAAEQGASAARDPGRRRRVRGAVRAMLQDLFPQLDPDTVAEVLGLDVLRGNERSGLVADESSDAAPEEESR